MRKSKLALKTETVRVLSNDSLRGVGGGAWRSGFKPCTYLESGCSATLTGNCQTQFCDATWDCGVETADCTVDCGSLNVCY